MARFAVEDLVAAIVRLGASDLHIKPNSPPIMRVDGELGRLEGYDKLSAEDVVGLLYQMLQDPVRLERLHRTGAVDFAYESDQGVRLRVNAFQEQGNFSIACRPIPEFIQTFADLNLPPVLEQISDEERGLILVTGTTGSGKSTTLAAMIDWINERKAKHIVTIEDPVEFVHRDKRAAMAQREVGRDTPSFHEALRYVLRQDPDVILIGEMRDEETVRAALTAAQTGHLVLSTLHTLDGPETVNRIIDFFEPHTQGQVRSMLAGTLRAIISQRLVPRADGGGRVPACEILRNSARVQGMLLNPDEIIHLHDAIADGSYYGMQSFDQALLHFVQTGKVALDDALPLASRPHDFRLLLESGGQRSGSLAHVDYFDDSEPPQ
ncbi:MAG: twitching motility protein PilT [Thermoleophilaceae bacterium]|nr:twitching motility protein PilT [Thermoleophilaceae bacterium]